MILRVGRCWLVTEGDLALLACGAFEENTEIGEVLDNIAGTITVIQNRIIDLPQADDDTVTMLGPFFARTLLENVMTALIGRLDPFRLLFTKKVQQHDSYELGRPSNAAIRWSGDALIRRRSPIICGKFKIVGENVSKSDYGPSCLIHKRHVERLKKAFEMLEYLGIIAKREASRKLKSGGRGPRYVDWAGYLDVACSTTIPAISSELCRLRLAKLYSA